MLKNNIIKIEEFYVLVDVSERIYLSNNGIIWTSNIDKAYLFKNIDTVNSIGERYCDKDYIKVVKINKKTEYNFDI